MKLLEKAKKRFTLMLSSKECDLLSNTVKTLKRG